MGYEGGLDRVAARLTARSRSGGFTLLELLATVVIIAVLGAIAIPNFRLFRMGMQTTETNNDLIADLNFARAEAVKRGVPVAIYGNGGTGWTSGWNVMADADVDGNWNDPVLKQHPAMPTGYKVNVANVGAIGNPLVFNGQGQRQSPAAGVVVAFVVCRPDNSVSKAREVDVSASGLITSQQGISGTAGVTCP